ncbi:MAG: hypothetical protein P4L93_10510 [Coriobacteriia bacterium]|nr:hypothetical protein [Coriobacteriia bacterium]
MSALTIGRIDVAPGALEALVRAEPAFARTSVSPALAQRALALLPGLARHTCENGTSHGMIAELSDTETPHLLEHVAVEIMALSGSPRSLRAETSWDFATDGPNVYRVRLAYDIDLVALGSLREGVSVVDWLMGLPAEKPDVDAIVAGLRAVRAAAAVS